MSLEIDPPIVLSQLGQLRDAARQYRRSSMEDYELSSRALGRDFSSYAMRLNKFFHSLSNNARSHNEVLFGLARKAENFIKEIARADQENSHSFRQ